MKLEEGEVICSKCEGSGGKFVGNPRSFHFKTICSKCHGEGKLDWISNAMGEPPIEVHHNNNLFIGSNSNVIITGSENVAIGYEAGFNVSGPSYISIGEKYETET